MATLDPVDIGSAANDGTGDPLRTAFGKLNDNDEALNTELASLGDLAALDTVGEDQIDASAVTYAKIQNVSAASKLLGSSDAGAGAVQEITLGSGISMSGTTLSASGAGLPTDDTDALVQDPADNTKRARIDAGAIATGTTRTIIMGDRDVDLAAAGTFAEASHTHPISQVVELASIASPTVIANVSGSSAAPTAVDPATFKEEFGFGSLAAQNNIVIADISASGTPSASTFLRGDGSWAGVVPSVSYAVTDIDDGTTLTAAHARYQIAGGALQILKLRLRHSTDQTGPVTVTMPDSDTVTPEGVEFDFIQADDQTGVCTIERETNGTINGATSVPLAGARATAVLIVDQNAGTAPVARLEGETDEARTLSGATTFADQAVFTNGVDINGASTLSHTLTLDNSGAIIGGDKVASALELNDVSQTAFDAGNKSGAASFDYRDGAWQFCTVTGNISSVTVTNWPATGKSGTLDIDFIQDGTGGKTIAWGAAFRFPGGTDFTLSAGAGAVDEFVLKTRTAGTTIRVYEAGKAFAA